MNVEKQETFGWLVAIDLFLTGAGAGVFLVSFVMDIINQYVPLARLGAVVGPILVLIGAVLLFADLRNRMRFYRLINNPSSWMARGTWGIAAFIIFGLGYSVPVLLNPQFVTTAPFFIFRLVAVISAFLVILYTGLLFGAARRIPLWNTPILTLLSFFSSLYTGMALFLMIASFHTGALDETFRAAVIAELILILLQIIVLGTFLGLAHYAGNIAAQSVRLLIKSKLFVFIVIIAGLIIPLGLLLYQSVAIKTFIPTILASILLLIGGLFLRQGILKSGIRLSISPY